MPEQSSAGLQHPCKLFDHTNVVVRILEEAERCKKIHDCVESAFPSCWKLTHVTADVAKSCACSPLSRDLQQMLRVIEAIHIISSFRKKMRVSALAAWNVEDTRSNGQPKDFDDPSCFLPVALERKNRLVFEKILRVEVRLPPLRRFAPRRTQKKTGSLYAPKTSSIAARIS